MKSKKTVGMLAYLATVTLVFSVVSLLYNASIIEVSPSQQGNVDVTTIDLEKYVVRITTDAAEIYDGVFYLSEDFASQDMTESAVQLNGEKPRLKNFGTIRFVLQLPAGNIYALSAKSAAYAQRLIISGDEYMQADTTGEHAGAIIPNVKSYTEAFLTQSDITEIILHYSNLVHPGDGSLYPIMLGTAGNIARLDQLRTFQVALATATLVTAALFFFGLYLFHRSSHLLWFSLVCAALLCADYSLVTNCYCCWFLI